MVVGRGIGRGELVSDLIPPTTTTCTGHRSIDDVLAEARGRLSRLTPAQARQARATGAVVVDIRPESQRQVEGNLPGALTVERNVLEWRFDPASQSRLPIADYDLQVIVLCSEGYASSLAAAALQELGVWRATDVIGGYLGWRAESAEAWPFAERQLVTTGALPAESTSSDLLDLDQPVMRPAGAEVPNPASVRSPSLEVIKAVTKGRSPAVCTGASTSPVTPSVRKAPGGRP